MIQIKRIYEPASDRDGMRILVDRIWPQGISRFDAKLDVWQKEVAPSTLLRKWFGHRPERWAEFQKRYRAELKINPAMGQLQSLMRHKRVTLLYAARDSEHNHALVLRALLSRIAHKKPKKPASKPSHTTAVAMISPVCFARDADPAYMGYLSPNALADFLNEMLEAEHASARVTLKSAQQIGNKVVKTLMESLHRDEAKWCAMLRREVRKLGATPSAKTGAFYGKAMAVKDQWQRLAFLHRGQGSVARKLKQTLPRIQDDDLHRDLSKMLKAHEDNIRLVAAVHRTGPTS